MVGAPGSACSVGLCICTIDHGEVEERKDGGKRSELERIPIMSNLELHCQGMKTR